MNNIYRSSSHSMQKQQENIPSLLSTPLAYQHRRPVHDNLLIPFTLFVFICLILFPLLQIIFNTFQEGVYSALTALYLLESLSAFTLTGTVVTMVTIVNTICGVGLAITIVRGKWLPRSIRRLLNILIDFPFAVSPVISGFMIVLLLGPHTIIGPFFTNLGYPLVYALPSIVLATVFVTFPLMVREVIPILQTAGTQQEETAKLLGANQWTIFWQVTWPSIRWGVIYGIILTIAYSLGEFGAVLIVSRNIMDKTQTITTLVYQDMGDFNVVAASSLAVVLVCSAMILFFIMESLKRYAKRKGVHR